MTAAYRMRGLGWFLGVVVVTLGFYLVSLQVAAERKKVDDVNDRIANAQREIRALETEFGTRGNLAQLERWNGEIFALTAPASDQFVADEATLASIDLTAPAGTGSAMRPTNYIVPAAPRAVAVIAPAPDPLTPQTKRVVESPHETVLASVAVVPPAPGARRGRTLAMLDRKLLSDSTIGDLVDRAQTEARILR